MGQNDAQFLHDENRLRTSKEEFRQNLQKLISLAKKFSHKIVFVGLVPVDENRAAPIPWDKNKVYKNDNLRDYNRRIKEMCEQQNFC
jgi:lysophospholipase L1-like esterase